MTMRRLAVVIAAVLVLGACKKRENEEARKVTTSSTDDATQAFVDEDYRFRIEWPGPGWKVLRERDARQLNGDAVAGLKRDAAHMIVIVEHAPDSELEPFAALIIENMMIEGKQVEQEPARVGDTPAIRIDVTGTYNDAPVRYRGLVLLHQDHAYQVLAYTLGDHDAEDLDVALDAFSLTPGTVRRRVATAEVEDRVGVGWRIASGVFESAASRVRVQPPAGWRLAIGAELDQMNTSAEVGMAGTEVDAYLVVIPDLVPGADRDGYVAARRAEAYAEATPLDAITATTLGRSVELSRARSEQGMVLELIHGVVFDRDRAYQVIGWYPASVRARAIPALETALAAIELLDDAALAALAAALADAPDPQVEVGAGYALRDGVYQDFTHGLRWRAPAGYWEILVGQAARAENADALLMATEGQSGLYAQLIVEPAAGWDAAGFHRTIVDNLVGNGLAVAGDGTARLAGEAARFTELETRSGGIDLRYRVTTAILGDVAIQAIVWSVAAAWPGDDAVAAVAAAIERAPGDEIEEGPPYRDHRLGFAMSMPPGWTRRDNTPTAMRSLGSLQHWRSGMREILVIAIFAVDQEDDDWMLDLLEQNVRESGAQLSKLPPRSETGTLAGLPARVVRWGKTAEVRLIHRDRIFYGVIATDPRGGGDVATIAAEAFSLLD